MNFLVRKQQELSAWAGMIVIATYLFFSAAYKANFAELNVCLPFLDFPIFIGEISLAIVMSLLALHYFGSENRNKKVTITVVVYLLFVLAKAFFGYAQYGALAFRHAALFYYPFYALAAFTFTRSIKIDADWVKVCAYLLLMFAMILGFFRNYYILSTIYISLALLLSMRCKFRIKLGLMALYIFVPWIQVFETTRTMLIGNLLSILFFSFLVFLIIKIKRRYKIISASLLLLILVFGVSKYTDKNLLKSLTMFKFVATRYEELDMEIQTNKNNPDVLKLQAEMPKSGVVFNKTEYKEKQLRNSDEIIQNVTKPLQKMTSIVRAKKEVPRPSIDQGPKMEKVSTPQVKKSTNVQVKKPSRPLHISLNTMLFRLFIWRDMLVEYKAQKPFLGFDFGYPLRSISLESLRWARSAWVNDGWISAHNSYLHMLYRSGLVGITIIMFLFYLFFRTCIRIAKQRNIFGAIMVGAVLIWFIGANFLPILDLPYYSIVAWSLMGMALGIVFRTDKKNEDISNT